MATAIPIGLLAWWILRLVGALWRRTVWRGLGPQLAALSQEHSGQIGPIFAGYRLSLGEGGSVRWTFGLRGRRTRWELPGGRGQREGWLSSQDLPFTSDR